MYASIERFRSACVFYDYNIVLCVWTVLRATETAKTRGNRAGVLTIYNITFYTFYV